MQTYVVEVLDEKAVPLLRDLENQAIIRLIPQETKLVEPLSKQFRNTIPPEVATDLQRQLSEMRSEWDRDI